MPEKKKSAAPKSRITARRTAKPQASKGLEIPEPARPTAASRAAATAAAQPASSQDQLANFEAAMKLFHARKLKEARELFLQAVDGPERDVAQRARLHVAMCDQRLQQAPVNLGSAEDYYNYGVALINARHVEIGRAHV